MCFSRYRGSTSEDEDMSQSKKHMGVSKNRGTPKWMVKIMENLFKMDDLGGKPTIFGNIHIAPSYFKVTWNDFPANGSHLSAPKRSRFRGPNEVTLKNPNMFNFFK